MRNTHWAGLMFLVIFSVMFNVPYTYKIRQRQPTLIQDEIINDDSEANKETHDDRSTPKESPKVPCSLQSHPTPMILMTLGRSGSSSMYQVLSKLSGNDTFPVHEYTGSDAAKSRKFFREEIPTTDVNGDWLVKYICRSQRHHPTAGIVGFKWKPWETIFTEEKALQGLELLGRLKNPQIKVVRSRRNMLDVIISKHKHSTNGKKIQAHCLNGDEKCVKQHLRAGTGISLPTARLLKDLADLDDRELRVNRLLAKMNVPTIHVSFEKLFSAGSDTSEWTKIFNYLGSGPSKDLTAADVERAGHVATSIPFHNVSLSNYKEVKEVLLGTEFESLLH